MIFIVYLLLDLMEQCNFRVFLEVNILRINVLIDLFRVVDSVFLVHDHLFDHHEDVCGHEQLNEE